MNTRQLLTSLVAVRRPARPIAVPLRLEELDTLQRRVVAARRGGDARPVKPERALFDDVQ